MLARKKFQGMTVLVIIAEAMIHLCLGMTLMKLQDMTPPYGHYGSHDSSMSGDGSHETSQHDISPDHYRSNDSPKSTDALSISNVIYRKN